MRSALVAIVCVGCASPRNPQGAESKLYVNQLEDTLQVNGPGYEMHFPIALNTVSMPDRLLIKGAGPTFASGTCPAESLVGTAVFPAAVAAGGQQGTSEAIIVQGGGGIVQIRIGYDVEYSCQGTQHLAGQSTFTFYPSARIVRHDVVSPQTNPFNQATGCGCQAGGATENLWFTSFWTFPNQLVNASGMPVQGNDAAALCAPVGPHLVALAWSPGATRAQRTVNNNWASVYDFANNQPTLANGTQEVTSAIQIGFDVGPQTCGTILNGLADLPISADGTELVTNEHGYYSDDTIRADSFDIKVNQRVPGFAAAFNLGSATHAIVTRDPESTPGWYTVQRLEGTARFLFWFSDGLDPGESITIEPF